MQSYFEYDNFVIWLKENKAIMEYFYEQILPLQWLSLRTINYFSNNSNDCIFLTIVPRR